MPDARHATASGREFRSRLATFYRWTVLPYGCWVCEDGRQVLFNRRYQPLWQRQGAGPPEPADCHERIGHAR